MTSSVDAIFEMSPQPRIGALPSSLPALSRQGTGQTQKDGQGSSSGSPDHKASNMARTDADGFLATNTSACFLVVGGDIKGHGYNDTDADVIAIPCVGASSGTWERAPFHADSFDQSANECAGGEPLDTPGISTHAAAGTKYKVSPNTLPTSWIRQGIRKEASIARIILYRHRQLQEGYSLDDAANDLLEQLLEMRAGLDQARPFFLVCHSIGGLVAKLALVKANQVDEFKPLIYACHGISFFGKKPPCPFQVSGADALPYQATPHRGSSYLSMPKLRNSIKDLLYLERPLPLSITEELRLGYKPLLEIHERFLHIVSEMRVWTFCETGDSQLSGLATAGHDEVDFSAPIVSIKSSLCNNRGEQVYSLESNHADCASFGLRNVRIMHAYLQNLGDAIRKARDISKKCKHHPLELNDNVKVELIGFYEDPDDTTDRDIRLYIAKHNLGHFLEIGPERCLKERLETGAKRPLQLSDAQQRPPSSAAHGDSFAPFGIINDRLQDFRQRISRSRGLSVSQSMHVETHLHDSGNLSNHDPERTPKIVLESQQAMSDESSSLSGVDQPTSGHGSSPHQNQIARTGLGNNLLGRHQAVTSAGELEDDKHVASASYMPYSLSHNSSFTSSQSEPKTSRPVDFQETTTGFSRPDPDKRRIVWIHLPFNNPYWVKVSSR